MIGYKAEKKKKGDVKRLDRKLVGESPWSWTSNLFAILHMCNTVATCIANPEVHPQIWGAACTFDAYSGSRSPVLLHFHLARLASCTNLPNVMPRAGSRRIRLIHITQSIGKDCKQRAHKHFTFTVSVADRLGQEFVYLHQFDCKSLHFETGIGHSAQAPRKNQNEGV